MTKSDDSRVDLVEEKTPYQGFSRIRVFHLRHRKHDGNWSDVIDREVFQRGDAAAVVLYDPAADAIVLLEQFRVSAWVAGRDPWQRETVAGMIPPGGHPEEVARRECLEETGCEVGRLEPIAQYFSSPGTSPDRVWLYCGIVDSTAVGGVHGLASEGEDIKVAVVPFADALAMADDGRIENATGIVALGWLARNRDRLRRTV